MPERVVRELRQPEAVAASDGAGRKRGRIQHDVAELREAHRIEFDEVKREGAGSPDLREDEQVPGRAVVAQAGGVRARLVDRREVGLRQENSVRVEGVDVAVRAAAGAWSVALLGNVIDASPGIVGQPLYVAAAVESVNRTDVEDLEDARI